MLTINCKGRLLSFEKPVVMGILNLTPDSFYSGSRTNSNEIVERAGDMIKAGATILDVGGQSTRPGSEKIGKQEELERVLPAIEAIAATYPDAIISIDTFYASVAEVAIEAGASIVNDVSAGTNDDMINTVAQLQVPYVLMHSKGTPQTMQQQAQYENVTLEVFDFLNFKSAALLKAGIKDIIIDPGFGFAKTTEHNFQLLRELEYFKQLQRPIMVGLSRKASIYKTLQTTPEEALNGTTALNTIATLNGASILRVHDVKEAMEVVQLMEVYKKKKEQ